MLKNSNTEIFKAIYRCGKISSLHENWLARKKVDERNVAKVTWTGVGQLRGVINKQKETNEQNSTKPNNGILTRCFNTSYVPFKTFTQNSLERTQQAGTRSMLKMSAEKTATLPQNQFAIFVVVSFFFKYSNNNQGEIRIAKNCLTFVHKVGRQKKDTFPL